MRGIALILFLAVHLAASCADARGTSASVSQTSSHGLRITLTVPRRQYPQNALIQVRLTVKNVSHHTISIQSGLNAPKAFVLDAAGSEVFDPLSPLGDNSLFTLMGPGPRYEALRRGKTWTALPYLVLRGSRIAFSVTLGKAGSSGGLTITGRPVTVSLTDEPAPLINVTTTPTLQASITPSGPVSGPLFYVDQTSCVTSAGIYSTGQGWAAIERTTITPDFADGSSTTAGCAGRRIWHGLVGWLNHPVAALSYEDVPSASFSLSTLAVAQDPAEH